MSEPSNVVYLDDYRLVNGIKPIATCSWCNKKIKSFKTKYYCIDGGKEHYTFEAGPYPTKLKEVN